MQRGGIGQLVSSELDTEWDTEWDHWANGPLGNLAVGDGVPRQHCGY